MNRLFGELVRVSIGTLDKLYRIPTQCEWETLYLMAEKQSLVGICFAGIKKLVNNTVGGYSRIGMSEEQFFNWMGATLQIQSRNFTVNQRSIELHERLSADGFKCCMLKGQGIALYYPEHLRDLRQSGDIDVWINADRLHLIDYVMKNTPSKALDGKHIAFKLFEDTEVELHWIPSVSPYPPRNRKLKSFYKSMMCQFNNEVCISGMNKRIIVAGADFNAVYLLGHILGHFLYEGIGLRQLMDYYFTLLHLREEDIATIRNEIKKLGWDRILSAVMYVETTLFGLEHRFLLCDPNSRLGEELLSEVLRGGNFGLFETQIKGAKIGLLHRLLRRLDRKLAFMKFDPCGVLLWPFYRLRVEIFRQRIYKQYGLTQ